MNREALENLKVGVEDLSEGLEVARYDSQETYLENWMSTEKDTKKCKGRPRQYLRLDEWNHFLSNDWKHLFSGVQDLRKMVYILYRLVWAILGVLLAISAGVIIKFITM